MWNQDRHIFPNFLQQKYSQLENEIMEAGLRALQATAAIMNQPNASVLGQTSLTLLWQNMAVNQTSFHKRQLDLY